MMFVGEEYIDIIEGHCRRIFFHESSCLWDGQTQKYITLSVFSLSCFEKSLIDMYLFRVFERVDFSNQIL
jgi:hypothetical protein